MLKEKILTTRQIQKLDQWAIQRLGIPSLVLMENAGRAVAWEAMKTLKNKRRVKVCIICGLGNNAGDGFVAARHLLSAHVNLQVFLIGSVSHLKQDPDINYQILKKMHFPVQEIKTINQKFQRNLHDSRLIIDAIFGVGLNRQIDDPFKSVIQSINQARKNVISVDIPSGLDGTTGQIYGVCVKASLTVTFSFIKRGFLINQGPKFVGKVKVAEIGIPLGSYKK